MTWLLIVVEGKPAGTTPLVCWRMSSRKRYVAAASCWITLPSCGTAARMHVVDAMWIGPV